MSIAVSGHYFVTDTLNDERKQCPQMQHPDIQYPVYVFCSYVNVVIHYNFGPHMMQRYMT